MRAFIGVFVIVLVLAAPVAARAGNGAVDLRKDRGWLPYRFRAAATMATGLARERGWITHQLYADPGGDGVDDLFRANDHGICGTPWTPAGAGRDWQTNLPVAFARKGPCASIDGVWDIDGDGRAEVVATAGTPDGFQWRLDVLDAATGARKWSVDLPAGRDERGDGNWDGFFRAFGPFTAHLADGAHPALLVGVEAGHDERPRGVLALDALDGHELWRYLTGAKPIAANIHLADLDGDSRQEICLLGAGVSNLEPGDEVDGAGDDHAMLFVLNDDGTPRWQRALGEAPASGWVETADVDGDGRAELVVTAFLTELGGEALAVLDATGAVKAALPLPSVCHSLAVVARGGTATAWLSFDGRAQRYEIAGTKITPGPEAELEGATQVALVADLVGDGAPEIVLGGEGGRNWLTDEMLRPLALLNDTSYRALKGATARRRLPAGARRLVVLGDPAHASAEFIVERNPRPVPKALIVAGMLLVGTAGILWRWPGLLLPPATVRALRLQLLERLVGDGHGRVGPLSAALRLIRFLASYAGQNAEPTALAASIRALNREMLTIGVPQLKAAADAAAFARVDRRAVREARKALKDLRATLSRSMAAWADAPLATDVAAATAQTLRTQVENTRVCYHRLRKIVEADFTASPGEILERSLAAHAERIDVLKVEIVRPRKPVPDCIVDAKDLEFVLDNLVENALRALEPVERRRLAIDWRLATDLVTLTVQDSGVGMTPAEAKAALEPGEGKRAGGGRGLPGSRERLRKYEGNLAVAATAPGQGTTMVLYLRPADVGAAPPAPEVAHDGQHA